MPPRAGAEAAGVTVDEWNRLNTEYGTVKNDPTKKAAWLKAHPNMSAGWEASGKVKDASAAIQQLAPTEPNWYDTGRATAVSKYGEKTVALAESYNNMTKAQRSAWIKANPAKYAQVKAVNGLLFAGKPGPAQRGTGYPRAARQPPQRFGESAVALAESYNAMSAAERVTWRKANAAKYAQVKAVNAVLFAYKNNSGNGSGYSGNDSGYSGSGSGYWRMYPAGVKVGLVSAAMAAAVAAVAVMLRRCRRAHRARPARRPGRV